MKTPDHSWNLFTMIKHLPVRSEVSFPKVLSLHTLLFFLIGCGQTRPSDRTLIEIHETLKAFKKDTRRFTQYVQEISSKLQYVYSHGEDKREYERVRKEFLEYLDGIDLSSFKKHREVEPYAKFSTLALDYVNYQKSTLNEFDHFYAIISKPNLSRADRTNAMKVFRKLNDQEEKKLVNLQKAMKGLYDFLNDRKK